MVKTINLSLPISNNNSSDVWPNNNKVELPFYDQDIIWPKISIVIPSYNQGQYIEETIRSILLQNYPNLELIIIDGGSTDDTVNIIKKYENYITYWVTEKDNGQSDAINKGLKKCTGDLFNWLNSDDYLQPFALFYIAKEYIKNKCLVVSGLTTALTTDKTQHTIPPVKIYKDINKTIQECGFNQPGLFYSMPCIRALKGVNTNYHYAMDLDMWNRFLFTYGQERVVKINKTIAIFRLHNNSKTSIESEKEASQFSSDINGMYYAYAKVIKKEKIWRSLSNVDQKYYPINTISSIPKESLKSFFNYYFYQLFKSHLYQKRFKKAFVASKGIKKIYLYKNLLKDIKINKFIRSS
ncbi:glycosyltransferase family 2 protein [Carboxylicivirga sp. N1Y90]|uniref:glycosyltransferase family 2 protein n=1 Tax=Carboxylicivirga fragile TaxID=3417571 RepID=UPI003D335F38|nr:glycosyltransferase [Marinilabiliaceae bacterium N1Y90]